MIEPIAEALRGQGERHGNTLILMAGDLEAAVATIKPVVQHLINAENRRAAP